LAVSAICLGTAEWGTKADDVQVDRLYETYRAAGGNCFDSAHVYAMWANATGASERALGACVRRHGDRGDVVLCTKGGHPDAGAKYPRPDRYLAAGVIARDVAESLERLGTDVIDLYFLHRDDARMPVAEIIEPLNEHVRAGRLRYLGASNWSTARIAEANAHAAARGLAPFVASQVLFNLGHPSKPPFVPFLAGDDLAWHAASGFPAFAFSATANGYFATDGQAAKGSYDNPTSRGRLERARQLAVELGVTPNRVALAYLTHQPFPVVPMTGTTSVEHLVDAVGAGVVSLTGEQVRWLRDGTPAR
jgi:aryl-alcohol dehydrogenase-like predicted oxidoreductase